MHRIFSKPFIYITFRTRMLLGFCSIITLVTIVLNASLMQISNFQHETLKQNALHEIRLNATDIAYSILEVKQLLTDVGVTHNQETFKNAEIAAGNLKKNLSQIRAGDYFSPNGVQKLNSLESDFDAFYDQAKQMAMAYMTSGLQAGNTIRSDLDQKSRLLDEKIKKLTYDTGKEYLKGGTFERTEFHAIKTIIFVTFFVTAFGLSIAIYLSRYLTNQLGIDPYYAKGIAKEIARGDLSRSIKVNTGDTKSLLFALEQMRQQLLARRTQDQKILEEILRIKFALDTVSVGVMITDDQHTIIYINNELKTILKNAESEIIKLMNNFSIDTIIGKKTNDLSFLPIDDQFRESLNRTHRIPVLLGNLHLLIVITPVINERGQRLGWVSEWHDQTETVMVESELAAVVAAASMGDFDRIFNIQGKDGVMRLLGEGINQLMHTNKISLHEISRVLSAITRGDLTEKITNPYFGAFGELKESTNATVEKLKGIISQIKEVTEVIHTGTKEIASGNNDLSHRTENQATSLQVTTTNVMDLTSAVQNNAENAKKANQLAIRATEVASKGGDVIGNVITTMQGINDSSRKVVDIISVINNIAFQTNILALNAAVEAARAGDQGRGFAVVAGEVRNLAKLAAAAAGEIQNLIGDSVEKIEDGTKLVAQAGETMDEILNSIQTVSVIMNNITTASAEQSLGIEEVNKAIAQMDEVTQQNAALVEQAAASAESLEEQAQNLAMTVESFKLD